MNTKMSDRGGLWVSASYRKKKKQVVSSYWDLIVHILKSFSLQRALDYPKPYRTCSVKFKLLQNSDLNDCVDPLETVHVK